jgi:imidazolonepropionase-like amidohydrolase
MLSIMKLCDEYGVKLAAFEHGLEGYRVANELKKYNVAITGFVDFWGYKWETFWTIPHNLAYLAKRGVLIAINSDSNTRMRRLYIDAAKTIRFGGLSEKEALAAITINPAIICGIEKYVGTLEPGKHADIAVFNRHPLDPYTRVEMTLVEGKILFDRNQYFADRKKVEEARKKKEAERKKREKEAKEKKKREAEKKPGVK